MTESVIQVNNLTKTYREGLFRRRVVRALSDVSLEIPRGEIFGLLGPNGAGKTTLIKVLLGIVRRTKGSAKVLGLRAGSRKMRELIGYLPEHNRIPGHLTGNSALEYYGGLSGMAARQVKQKRGELLEKVGLAEWGTTNVRKYSKGMLQRLGLAQAMLHDPELIILDEPTDGVDPVGRKEIRAVLQSLREQGTTIFLNSHLLQEVELVCDRVAILSHGTVRKVADISDLTQQSADRVFTLSGSDDEIYAAFSASGNQDALLAPVEGGVTVRFTPKDSKHLNYCIDQLRERKVQILSITTARTSLEEVFISIIEEQDD